jgi:branched-chain amino acid aminotransferase
MIKLQQPAYAYMNGRLTPWDDARIHVGAEALVRGVSVFEGIKGYWRHDGRKLNLLALRDHYERLVRSARFLHLPFALNYEEFEAACRTLVRELMVSNRDLWLRPTVFAVEGYWGEQTVTDLVITCYGQDKKRPEPMDIGISTWQRASDVALPARIKSAANYQMSRLARIEGRRQGYDDMILLNAFGRVSEATGSCVLMVRNGRVVTPPATEGCLESITVNIVETLCQRLGIAFERRPIDRTELTVADEICLAGTLMELGRVRNLESLPLPATTPILDRISDEFWGVVRGERTDPLVSLTPV